MRTLFTAIGFFGFFTFYLNSGVVAQVPKRQLIVFEGSDWCAKCIRLNREVLNDSSFIAFAQKENIDVIHVDFPQRKKLSTEVEKANTALAEKYRFQGSFPTLILTDGDGRSTPIAIDGDARYTEAAISETISRWH